MDTVVRLELTYLHTIKYGLIPGIRLHYPYMLYCEITVHSRRDSEERMVTCCIIFQNHTKEMLLSRVYEVCGKQSTDRPLVYIKFIIYQTKCGLLSNSVLS